jgi:hypothetical protein
MKDYDKNYKIQPYMEGIMTQKYNSAATSLNQVPSLIKMINDEGELKPGTLLLDFGAGKFSKTREYVEGTSDTSYHAYDPYNLPEDVNNASLERKYDVIMLSNVLNVVKEKDARKDILNLCRLLMKPGARLYIRTYQAPKSDLYQEDPEPGQPTKNGTCWQMCQPLSFYMEEIQEVLPNITIKRGYLIAKN